MDEIKNKLIRGADVSTPKFSYPFISNCVLVNVYADHLHLERIAAGHIDIADSAFSAPSSYECGGTDISVTNVSLYSALIYNTLIENVKFIGVSVKRGLFIDVYFRECVFAQTRFSECIFVGCTFDRCSFRDFEMDKCYKDISAATRGEIRGYDLRGTPMRNNYNFLVHPNNTKLPRLKVIPAWISIVAPATVSRRWNHFVARAAQVKRNVISSLKIKDIEPAQPVHVVVPKRTKAAVRLLTRNV